MPQPGALGIPAARVAEVAEQADGDRIARAIGWTAWPAARSPWSPDAALERAAYAARAQRFCGILAWGGRGPLSPWVLFVLTCLLMAAVLGIIALVWTEGFARLARFAAARARSGRGARPSRQVE